MNLNILQACKNLDELRICKRLKPSYLISETQSCETVILRCQNKEITDQMCQFSVFRILELVFVPLKNPNQYILVPETPLELNVLCRTRLETLRLNSASLLSINTDCIIQTPRSILKLRKSKIRQNDIYYKKNVSYKLNAEDINLLGPQLPLIQESRNHENFKELRQSLDDMQTSLQTIKSRRRTRSWIVTSTDVLTYLGYAALIIVTLYMFYKTGFFDWLRRLIPKNLCIRLFCVFNNVTTTHTVHYTAVATAPPICQDAIVCSTDPSSIKLSNDDKSNIVKKRLKLRT